MATGKMGFLESHHRVNRKTYGSILLFAGILLAYLSSLLTFKISLFVLPLLILAISDPVAALSGLTIKSKNWTNLFTNNKSSKTIIGSGAFFITSFLILFFGLPNYNDYSTTSYLIISLAIGLIVSVIETISSSGYDNLTIPASVISLLLLSEFFFT
jgi:dolichol kinase